MFHEPTAVAARGKWRGILASLGVPENFLRNKHGPCPLCGEGRDRWRFDDKGGTGTWICSVCGAGEGLELVKRFLGVNFAEAASRVDEVIRNVKPESTRVKSEMTEEQIRTMLRAVWAETRPIEEGDIAWKYLTARGLAPDGVCDLRSGRALRDGEGAVRPALVAMVRDPSGKPATMHRTFLKPDGSGKAEMASPRKLMPGRIPPGSSIHLSAPCEVLGIAEGIETALAASILYELPVWSAINSTMLAKWLAPPECREVCIFGDNDPGFAGQEAAYELARRLRSGGLDVVVEIPEKGDWNDVLRLSAQAPKNHQI